MEAHFIDWDGSHLPSGLQRLPPGRYIVERVDETLEMTEEEDNGIRQALDDMAAGNRVSLEDALAKLRPPKE
jgi:hypothetical protein